MDDNLLQSQYGRQPVPGGIQRADFHRPFQHILDQRLDLLTVLCHAGQQQPCSA